VQKIQSRIADSDTKKEIEVGEARREEINSGEDSLDLWVSCFD